MKRKRTKDDNGNSKKRQKTEYTKDQILSILKANYSVQPFSINDILGILEPEKLDKINDILNSISISTPNIIIRSTINGKESLRYGESKSSTFNCELDEFVKIFRDYPLKWYTADDLVDYLREKHMVYAKRDEYLYKTDLVFSNTNYLRKKRIKKNETWVNMYCFKSRIMDHKELSDTELLFGILEDSNNVWFSVDHINRIMKEYKREVSNDHIEKILNANPKFIMKEISTFEQFYKFKDPIPSYIGNNFLIYKIQEYTDNPKLLKILNYYIGDNALIKQYKNDHFLYVYDVISFKYCNRTEIITESIMNGIFIFNILSDPYITKKKKDIIFLQFLLKLFESVESIWTNSKIKLLIYEQFKKPQHESFKDFHFSDFYFSIDLSSSDMISRVALLITDELARFTDNRRNFHIGKLVESLIHDQFYGPSRFATSPYIKNIFDIVLRNFKKTRINYTDRINQIICFLRESVTTLSA